MKIEIEETEIEALARMVANGFSSMDKRFDSLENRMDRMDTRMDRVEMVVTETNRLIDQIIMPTQDDHARHIKDLELQTVA
jgi:hypothetical protein